MHVFIHESRQREGEMLGRLRTASGNLKIEGWGVTYENGICAGIDAPAAGQAGGKRGGAGSSGRGLRRRYQALYGSGAFTLTAKRCGDAAAYPVAVSTEGGDVVWLVRAADVASPGSGSCELTYTVDGAVAKSQTWSTYVAASISGDAPGEPPEEPARRGLPPYRRRSAIWTT